MRILLVKTTSLGDVIHNLPVVTDLRTQFPEAVIDWCVEESFAGIPRLHPGVEGVITVAVRRWRKALFKAQTWQEMAQARKALQAHTYDAILDTQGLLKSALLARQARGLHLGYAAESAREPFAARFYDQTFGIPVHAHAVIRNRWLAAAALDFPPDLPLDYGISPAQEHFEWLSAQAYAVLLTATSRDDKLWEELHWVSIGRWLAERGVVSVFPSGSPVESARAQRLAAQVPGAVAAPPLGLESLSNLLGAAKLAVGVDTGLTHLAAALKVPTLALYTATDPGLTGVLGTAFHRNLGGKGQSPTPEAVVQLMQGILR